VREKTDLLMAGYIGLVTGLISLVAGFGLTLCLGATWNPAKWFYAVMPALVFSVAGWVAGRLWRTQGGTATWLECALATPSTWAAPVLCLVFLSLQEELDFWLPGWLLWFIPAYPLTYLGLRSKPKPAPRHCVQCGYDLTGNVSGRCPECAQPIPLSQRAGSEGGD
jgi:hypothetical protein